MDLILCLQYFKKYTFDYPKFNTGLKYKNNFLRISINYNIILSLCNIYGKDLKKHGKKEILGSFKIVKINFKFLEKFTFVYLIK